MSAFKVFPKSFWVNLTSDVDEKEWNNKSFPATDDNFKINDERKLLRARLSSHAINQTVFV